MSGPSISVRVRRRG